MAEPINLHNLLSSRRVALLIDAENVPNWSLDQSLAVARSEGYVVSTRLYADWTQPSVNKSLSWASTVGAETIQSMRPVVGKSTTDMCMALDTIDLVAEASIETVVLVSGDSDMRPLVLRLRRRGIRVVGVARPGTMNSSYTSTLDKLVLIEQPVAEFPPSVPGHVAPGPVGSAGTSGAPAASGNGAPGSIPSSSDQSLHRSGIPDHVRTAVFQVFLSLIQPDGWCRVSKFAATFRHKHPEIDIKLYGRPRIKAFIEKTELFKLNNKAHDLQMRALPKVRVRVPAGNTGSARSAVRSDLARNLSPNAQSDQPETAVAN